MRSILLLISFVFSFSQIGTAQNVVIEGYAPTYVGKSIELFEIEDYFSYHLKSIAKTTVKEDSTFTFYFDTPHTQKVIIKSNNNEGFLYVQKDGKYDIYFPERDKYDPYRPTGNQVEIAFFDLDSLDINYKILGFQRWMDDFIGRNYYLKDAKPVEFAKNMELFKTNVEKAYKGDSLDRFFQTYVRFSIAKLDNIQTASQRNRYEKHDFYIKYTPVQYENDAYMQYIIDFYEDMIPRLSNEANQEVYMGVVKASPTLIMKALGSEYTLINIRIREMVMIKALADVYHSGDYPETNIISILDSVENFSLFKANGVIAKNIRARLTEMVPGGKAAPIVFNDPEASTKTLFDYSGKHLYIHVLDPNSTSNMKEIDLLKELNERYGEFVNFVTVFKRDTELTEDARKTIESIPWDVFSLSPTNSFWKDYDIRSYPTYVLIDAAGYIVAHPALGPTPNGQYETIDKTFFYIRKAREQEKQ